MVRWPKIGTAEHEAAKRDVLATLTNGTVRLDDTPAIGRPARVACTGLETWLAHAVVTPNLCLIVDRRVFHYILTSS